MFGTAFAALLLVAAGGLPLTRHGPGSALAALDTVRIARSVPIGSLRWGALLLIGVLSSGIGLGVLVPMRSRWAVRAWSVLVALVGVVGLLLLGLFRSNAGPSPYLVLGAGLVAAASALIERRLERGGVGAECRSSSP